MLHFSYTVRNLLVGILTLLGLSIFSLNVLASTVPEGSITVPSSCSAFPCNVDVSWVVTENPDGAPTSSMRLKLNGSQIGSGQSGSLSGVALSAPSNFTLTVGSTIVDDKSVALAASTPTPTPIPKTCDQDCSGGQSCVSGLSCINNKCRLPSYPNESSCSAPSYPEYRSCNQSCGGGNQQCLSGLSCINNVCRHPQNQNDTSCSAPAGTSSSTPTPTKVPTGGTGGSVLGSKASNVTPTVNPDGTTSESTAEGETLGSQASGETTLVTPTPTPVKGLIEKVASNPVMAGVFLIGVAALGFTFFKIRKSLA